MNAGLVGAGTIGAGLSLQLDHLTLGYGGVPAVEDLSGQFQAGSLTAVIGPNGGGKTTLLKGLMGLLLPLRGSIRIGDDAAGASNRGADRVADADGAGWRDALAWLAQRSEVDPSFPITVADFVSIGLWSVTGSLSGVTPAQRWTLEAALEQLGLAGAGRRWISDLSGGQFQRMRFARLLVQDAPVVLLDEPFAGVDESTIEALLRLIAGWQDQGRTVIVVLHDLNRVRRHFPMTLALDRRMLAWGETAMTLASLAGMGPHHER